VLSVDCPWRFSDKLPGDKRGAEKHYNVMTVEQLKRFELPPIDDNAIMFFWRVSSMQQEALDVIKAWGFTVKSELVWVKTTKTGKRHFGMGRYTRMEHEVCLICVKGLKGSKSSFAVQDKSVRSTFEAPVGVHSSKPDEFFAIVDRLVGKDARKVELFARKHRKGWVCFGDELPEEQPTSNRVDVARKRTKKAGQP